MKSSSVSFSFALYVIVTSVVVSSLGLAAQQQKVKALRKEPSSLVKSTQLNTSVPKGWQKVDAEGKFTFYLPPCMEQTDVMGIESLMREYTNGRMRLIFDYRPSDFLGNDEDDKKSEFGKGYQEASTKIAGKPARIFTYSKLENNERLYATEIHFGDVSRGQTDLWMWASSPNASDIEVAKQVFYSVRFR